MRRRRKHVEEVGPDLNRVTTPFLDMAFQILFFFAATYEASALEGHLDMALPATGTSPAPKDQKPEPVSSEDTNIDIPAELTVLLRTRDVERQDQVNDGSLGRISVKDQAGEKQVGNLTELRTVLEKLRPNLTNQTDIKLEGDGRLKYTHVIEVMDVCRKAGFNNVGFSPPPDLERVLIGR